jgi:hypothetical protein
MLSFQHFLQQDWTRPLALVVMVYTVIATIYQHFKKREKYPEGVKGSLAETGEALLMIASISAVQFWMHQALPGYRTLGVDLHSILDIAHLAVAVRWVTKCLLRFMS